MFGKLNGRVWNTKTGGGLCVGTRDSLNSCTIFWIQNSNWSTIVYFAVFDCVLWFWIGPASFESRTIMFGKWKGIFRQTFPFNHCTICMERRPRQDTKLRLWTNTWRWFLWALAVEKRSFDLKISCFRQFQTVSEPIKPYFWGPKARWQ